MLSNQIPYIYYVLQGTLKEKNSRRKILKNFFRCDGIRTHDLCVTGSVSQITHKSLAKFQSH